MDDKFINDTGIVFYIDSEKDITNSIKYEIEKKKTNNITKKK